MLNQSAATGVQADNLNKKLYECVGIKGYDDEFRAFLNKNFSPYNFILGLNPYIIHAKRGQIGHLRRIEIFRYTQSSIINELCLDLEELNYEYRILDVCFSDKSLNKNEFLLKLFICDASEEHKRGDYRIMRYDTKVGEWFFKPSLYEAPILCKDSAGVIMISQEPVGYVCRVNNLADKEFYPFAYVAVRPMRLRKKLWKAVKLFVKWTKDRCQ